MTLPFAAADAEQSFAEHRGEQLIRHPVFWVVRGIVEKDAANPFEIANYHHGAAYIPRSKDKLLERGARHDLEIIVGTFESSASMGGALPGGGARPGKKSWDMMGEANPSATTRPNIGN